MMHKNIEYNASSTVEFNGYKYVDPQNMPVVIAVLPDMANSSLRTYRLHVRI